MNCSGFALTAFGFLEHIRFGQLASGSTLAFLPDHIGQHRLIADLRQVTRERGAVLHRSRWVSRLSSPEVRLPPCRLSVRRQLAMAKPGRVSCADASPPATGAQMANRSNLGPFRLGWIHKRFRRHKAAVQHPPAAAAAA